MFHKILVAMDMSQTTREIFEVALDLAVNKASLMLLHILCPTEKGNSGVPLPIGMNDYPGASWSDWTYYQKQQEALAEKGLEQLRLQAEIATAAGVRTEYAQNSGSPGSMICEVALTWRADLIVIGRRGLSGVNEMLLGSVSNYVLHHAPCSVLTVQSQPRRSSQKLVRRSVQTA